VTLKVIWFHPLCHEQGHLLLDQVAHSSIQLGLEHIEGGGIRSFSGQPVPVFHHPHGEEFRQARPGIRMSTVISTTQLRPGLRESA